MTASSRLADKARPPGGAPGGLFRNYVKHRELVLLFLPGLLYYLIFRYGPMYGVLIAFKDYRFSLGILRSPWNDFQNFKQVFSTESFAQAFFNTLIISSYKLVFTFPAPIALALLLNEVRASPTRRVPCKTTAARGPGPARIAQRP